MTEPLLDLEILDEATLVEVPMKPVRLIVTDIEGCVNRDERSYDHDALAWLRRASKAASTSNAIPHLALCTGRQAAFAEAVTRMVDTDLPAIFENGCGLFHIARDSWPRHEFALTLMTRRDEIERIRAACGGVVDETKAVQSIGKEILWTLHPVGGMTVQELRGKVEAALASVNVSASVANSASAVDIAPHGVDKGTGLQWLVSTVQADLHVSMGTVAAVGDSRGDIPALTTAAFSAAPANCSEEVRVVANYVSLEEGGRGLVDIYRHCIERNLKESGK